MATLYKCTDCGKLFPLEKGIDHDEGFLCHTCIQNEHYRQMDEMLNDPAHINYVVDDIFIEDTHHRKNIRLMVIFAALLLLFTIITTLILAIRSRYEENYQPSNINGKWNQTSQEKSNRKGGM